MAYNARSKGANVREAHGLVEKHCGYSNNFTRGERFAVLATLIGITGIVVTILVVVLHTENLKRHTTAVVQGALQQQGQLNRAAATASTGPPLSSNMNPAADAAQ